MWAAHRRPRSSPIQNWLAGLPGPPFVVPFLGLIQILVRIMVRNPQKELQMGLQVTAMIDPVGLTPNPEL